MKIIRKILTLALVTTLFATLSYTASASVAGDIGQFFGEMFSVGDDSISFKDFENLKIDLDPTAGYAEELVASTDLKDFIITIVNWALGFLGLLSVLVVIYGGVLYVSSGGEEEKTQTGKKAITYAAIGILIILGSFAFVNTIIKGATEDQPGGAGTIGAAFAGGGFNASASEVRALAEEIYSGYVFLEETTEELKNIKNDAEKGSLDPNSFPSKSEVISFLDSVRAKLKNIADRSDQFSSTEAIIEDILRKIDKDMLDVVNSLSDNETYLALLNDNSSITCPSTKDEIIDDLDLGVRVEFGLDCLINLGGIPNPHCIAKSGILENIQDMNYAASFADLTWEEACVEVGYNVKYTPGLYGEWSEIRNYFIGDYPESIINDQLDIYTAVLEPIASDYEESLYKIFAKLHLIYDDLSVIDAIAQGQGAQYYYTMQDNYGYDAVVNIDSTGKEVANVTENNGLLSQVADWSVNSDINISGEYLITGIEAHAGLYKVLTDLEYVKAQLGANVVEGSSPLTVIFDTSGTVDPAGGTIRGSNIYWDIGGTKTTDELLGAFDFDEDDIDKIYDNEYVTCTRSTEALDPEIDDLTEADVVGTTSKRCTFHKPGAYTAAIKVNSNAPNQFAPGISVLVIKVKPPTTKIELKAGIGESMADEQTVMHYEGETLLIDRRTVNFTFGKASEGDGVCFDAIATQASQYQWTFGNNQKVEYSPGAGKECTKYIEAGTYEVLLEVVNDLGDVDKKIFTVKVSSIAARLKASPATEAFINEPVTFDASEAVSDLGKIKNYEWSINIDADASQNLSDELIQDIEDHYADFTSNNSGEILTKIVHEFPFPGVYSVKVKVTDESGEADEEEIKFLVKSKPPVALFDYEIKRSTQPGTVYLSATKSYDPDNEDDRMNYSWSIEPDDDSGRRWECMSTNCSDLESFNEVDPIIKFKETGDYEVTLKVESYGESHEITRTVGINNVLDIEWGEAQETTAQLNDNSEAQIKFILVSENATEYEIEFGDGDTTAGEFPAGSNTTEVVHTYNYAETFIINAKVYDEDYNDNQIQRRIFIGDGKSPIAKISLRVNGVEITDLSSPIDVTRKDILTLDGSKSVNLDGTGKDLGYSWDMGSDKSSSKSATHKYDDLGNYTIELQVFDKEDPALISSDSVDIRVVAVPPKFSSIQAIPDSRNDEMITPVNVNVSVLGAEDEDGQIVQYKWWYFDTDDPDERLGIQITQNPNAKLIIGTNGDEGFSRTYGFGVEVTDSDNSKVSSDDILDESRIPIIEVVNGPNELPEAKFNVNTTTTFSGEEVIFTSASNDPDGDIVAYIWDIDGDGFGNDAPTDESTYKHVYTQKNLKGYDVRLKVVDDKGGESISDTITIYVDSLAEEPVAAFKFEAIDGSGGKKIKFINNSVADEDVGATIISNKWDFDTTSLLETADSDGDGVADNDIDSTSANPQRLYTTSGTYDVKLTVTDNQGNEDEVVKTVTVPMADPPTAAFTYEIIAGAVHFKNNSTADTDKSAEIEKYIWDFDTTSALKSADSDGDGDSTNDEDSNEGNPIYQYEFSGIYDVKLTVIDNQGSEDSVINQIDTSSVSVPSDDSTSDLVAFLTTDPLPDSDGYVYLSGDSGSVTFDFSKSQGAIAYYIFDKNIHFDTDGNGIKNDDQDFKTTLPGTWKTNFEKEWGKIVVKLTITDIYGNEKSISQEIKF